MTSRFRGSFRRALPCIVLGTLVVVSPTSPVHGRLQADDPRPAFADWLAGVRTEAEARGIRAAVLDEALAGLEPIETVRERDRSQAEFVLSFDKYIQRWLTTRFVRTGRQHARTHRTTLAKVSRAYGVPSRVLVAIWGVESNYGRFSGVRPVIATLATLAYDPRRGTFFRGELLDALSILDRGDIELDRMKGSWAGAMGQPQFMPSSYLKYAKDQDGDGRRDIWTSRADVFASIANYLSEHGWKPGETWGREVSLRGKAQQKTEALPFRTEGCRAEQNMSDAKPMREWRALGVRLKGGGTLPSRAPDASLVRVGNRAFLVYRNYEALLRYNCAHHYALGVALLSDRLR